MFGTEILKITDKGTLHIPMRIHLLLLLWLFVPAVYGQKYQTAIVAFYNLENLFDTLDDPLKNDDDFTPKGMYNYNTYIYQDKLEKLSDVLSQIGSDINPDGFALAGLAEVENRKVLEDLTAQPKLKDRHLKIIHIDGPDERSVDCALLYNPKYFTVKHSKSLFVPLGTDHNKGHFTRDILWVTGILGGTDTLHVFVNHWPSRRGGEEASAPARAAAASVAKRVIDSLMQLDPYTKIVLMGDLNDDPTSPSVAKVLGATGKINEVGPGQLYNPWWSYFEQGIGTLAYNDSWNLFDQIIVSYGLMPKKSNGFFFQEARIFKRQFMLTTTGKFRGYPKRTFSGNNYLGGYSDHLPTYCILLREVTK
ncbi:MAG: endonuclease/exonuclease/phosphatase [Chitinophagales bacterium]|nr:endonuclease/exonuclease/phosphatase [Chitinophagales bacterium]MDW8419389.1 endonuclease/exonuclease/phosphatase [Chitinophagales bacterium]